MTLPRCHLQLAESGHKKRRFNLHIWAILDSGSSLNLLSTSILPATTKLTPSPVRFKGVNNTTSPSRGTCSFFIRPLHPDTKHPLGESSKPVTFHVSDCLPDACIIGMPLLVNSKIDFVTRSLTLNLGKRSLYVPFCSASAFLTTEPQSEALRRITKTNEISLGALGEPNESQMEMKADLSQIKINDNIPYEAKERIHEILHRYSNCFQQDGELVSYFKNGDHQPLRFTTTSSIYTQPRRIPIPKSLHAEFRKQLKIWLDQKVVVPQDRVVEYRSNFVPVKKKDGTWRFCLDTRNLNAIMSDENGALPGIQDILSKSAGKKFYSSLDIRDFFLLFKLDRPSSDMLTFACPVSHNLYRFCRSIFGVKGSMSNAILLLNNELAKLDDRHEWLNHYVDDFLVAHDDLDTHIRDLERLLALFESVNLKLKPSKITIAFPTCDIFGYTLSMDGYTIEQSRKNDILKLPKPQSKKQLLSILGKASYFRNIMGEPGMGYFNGHFRSILSEKNKYVWTEKHDELWDQLKTSIKNNIMLQAVLPTDNHMIVRTDASSVCMGATLSALRNDEEVLVNTMSRCWSQAVVNYHCTRLELLSSLLALDAFKYDLIGRRVDLYVDNAAAYFVLKHPHKVDCFGTLIPKLLYAIRYITYTVHKTDNKDPKWALVDYLSRAQGQVVIRARNVRELLEIEPDPDPENCIRLTHTLPVNTAVKGIQVHAPLLALRQFKDLVEKVSESTEYKRNGTVPLKYRRPLLLATHNMGHIGIIPSAGLLTSHDLMWKGRNDDLKLVISSCEECGIFRHRPGPINIRQSEIAITEPKHALCIDVATVGQPAIINFLVSVDLFTDYTIALRIPGQLNSTTIAKTLLCILARYAPSCAIIRMDNASYFTSRDFKQFLKDLNIKQWLVTRLNSRSNGKCERMIRSIKEQLRFFRLNSYSGHDWDIALEIATLAVNLKPKFNKISPFTLTYGTIEPKNPSQLPTIRTEGLAEYQLALTNRIKALRSIIQLYYENPVEADTTNLYPVGSLIRIKASATRNFNSITQPKYTQQLYEIMEVRKDTQSYKIRCTVNKEDIRYAHHRHTKLVMQPERQTEINEKAAELIIPPKKSNARNQKFKQKTIRQPHHGMKLRSRDLTGRLMP